MEGLSDFILFCLIIPSMMVFVFLIMFSPEKPTKIKKSDIFDEKEIDDLIEKLTKLKNSLK